MKIYWYISKAKLDLLVDQAPGFLTGIKATMSFKFPLLSGTLEGTEPARLAKDLQRVSKRLYADPQTRPFSQLAGGESPAIISFEGPTVRHIDDGVFWLAMQDGHTGLILAGSAGYAIGAPPQSDITISPSADPVGAIESAFADTPPAADPQSDAALSLSWRIGYAWKELMSDAALGTLPQTRGLAVFGRTIPLAQPPAGQPAPGNVQRIVVASPIFVEQV